MKNLIKARHGGSIIPGIQEADIGSITVQG
jgi:hypothetical protein